MIQIITCILFWVHAIGSFVFIILCMVANRAGTYQASTIPFSSFLLYPCYRYIEEEDLLRFLRSDAIHTTFPLFEGAIETGRITKSSFRNWVVSHNIYPFFLFFFFVWIQHQSYNMIKLMQSLINGPKEYFIT